MKKIYYLGNLEYAELKMLKNHSITTVFENKQDFIKYALSWHYHNTKIMVIIK